MKIFLKNIIQFTIIIIGIFGSVVIIKLLIYKSLNFKEPNNVHYLFIGASHSYRGIDESLLTTAVNKSAPSERYLYSYLKLKRILDANPQIDTVYIECAPTDLWENTDDKYFTENEMSKFIPLYYPLFSKEEWNVYSDKLINVVTLIVQKSFNRNQFIASSILHDMGSQATKEENEGKMDKNSVIPNLIEGKYGHKINHLYLRKIMKLCSEKEVKLYGLYFPMYHPEYYYNQKQYYDVLLHKFPDLDLLDYHDLHMPDSARLDAHHLNLHGAKIFTYELQKRFNIR